jgi:heme/copper-type cytochrome/quinol oxidase subunit 2
VVRLPSQTGPRLAGAVLGALFGIVVLGAVMVAAQTRVTFAVSAHKYGYRVSGSDSGELLVRKGDMVRITFSADDIPHSFTIDDDHYRISRRAEPGKPVMFDFLADKAGTFEIYCNLSNDPRCRRETRGKLIVEGK